MLSANVAHSLSIICKPTANMHATIQEVEAAINRAIKRCETQTVVARDLNTKDVLKLLKLGYSVKTDFINYGNLMTVITVIQW